jgi:hypothetical protein
VCGNEELEQSKSCEVLYRDCRLGCTGLDDHSCTSVCIETRMECEDGIEAGNRDCWEACPCWSAYLSCEDGCDSEDDWCYDDCYLQWELCAGQEVVRAVPPCIWRCDDGKFDCEDACYESHGETDWEAYVRCDHDCRISYIDCVIRCH